MRTKPRVNPTCVINRLFFSQLNSINADEATCVLRIRYNISTTDYNGWDGLEGAGGSPNAVDSVFNGADAKIKNDPEGDFIGFTQVRDIQSVRRETRHRNKETHWRTRKHTTQVTQVQHKHTTRTKQHTTHTHTRELRTSHGTTTA